MSEYLFLPQLIAKLKTLRPVKTAVLVTGCFDILHSEHIKFLKAAKAKGDILILGIEPDSRVKELKGSARPIYKLEKRVDELNLTQIPDFIFTLPAKFNKNIEHEALIAKIRPQILAISSHTLHQDKKREIIKRYGGELRIVLTHNPSVSSTKLNHKLTALDKNTRAS